MLAILHHGPITYKWIGNSPISVKQ